MKKDRKSQRTNRIIQKRVQHIKRESREERIDIHNAYGIKDPTPYEAVNNMIQKEWRRKAG